MSEIVFFLSKGPFYLNELSDDTSNKSNKLKISDIKTLEKAGKKDLTFFSSINYKSCAIKTKAAVCITTKNLEQYLPESCIKIVVKNVLYSTAKISKKFYPNADLDYPDKSLVESKKVRPLQPFARAGASAGPRRVLHRALRPAADVHGGAAPGRRAALTDGRDQGSYSPVARGFDSGLARPRAVAPRGAHNTIARTAAARISSPPASPRSRARPPNAAWIVALGT